MRSIVPVKPDMYVEAQPRKRKDKKRKKEDGSPAEEAPPPSQPSEDCTIHVHKDPKTGGGICAKVIFFLLFALLIGLTGVIILESRGQQDAADNSPSRFSHFFEGWVDEAAPPALATGGDKDHLEEEAANAWEPEDHSEEQLDEGHLDGADEASEQHEDDEYLNGDAHEENEGEDGEDGGDGEDDEDEPPEDYLAEQDGAAEEPDDDSAANEEDENLERESEEVEANNGSPHDDVFSEYIPEEVNAAAGPRVSPPLNVGFQAEDEYGLDEAEEIVDNDIEEELMKKRSAEETTGDGASGNRSEGSVEKVTETLRRNTIIAPPSVSDFSAQDDESVEEVTNSVGEEEQHRQDLHYAMQRPADEYGDEEEDEDEEENGERSDETDGEDLMRRLEERYGKADATDEEDLTDDLDDEEYFERDDRRPQYQDVQHPPRTAEDWILDEELDQADARLREDNAAQALAAYEQRLAQQPHHPRALLGKAMSLDRLAEQRRSNDLLKSAIQAYEAAMRSPDAPAETVRDAGRRLVAKARFLGLYSLAVPAHRLLISRFPGEAAPRNQLAVTYLMQNNIPDARETLRAVLDEHPDDGFAQVHYGFVLKTADNDLERAVRHLRAGIRSGADGVADGRFYFHLGDALSRLGRREEALQVYEEAASKGLFLSAVQRSLYNVDRLRAQPWWRPEDTPYAALFGRLLANWRAIRAEAEALLDAGGHFRGETEQLRDTGDWRQLELFARGVRAKEACRRCPLTCSLVESAPEASGCRRGQVKFSAMQAGTHVWPHCGPTNCRLRAHLGLRVPPGAHIRVANETRTWREGELLLFDDSFEHEVWHNGTGLRLVLIVDVWHPELTALERRTLPPI